MECKYCGSKKIFKLRLDSDCSYGSGYYYPVNDKVEYTDKEWKMDACDRPDIDVYHCLEWEEYASKNVFTYEQLYRFKEYWDELYGDGLEVANWNYNGTTVPFDNFYDSALEYMKEEMK